MRRVRSVVGAAVLAAGLGGVVVVPGAFAANGANTTRVCHVLGDGTLVPLDVNANALGGHLGHGDVRPGDRVLGHPKQVYNANCQPVRDGDGGGSDDPPPPPPPPPPA